MFWGYLQDSSDDTGEVRICGEVLLSGLGVSGGSCVHKSHRYGYELLGLGRGRGVARFGGGWWAVGGGPAGLG